MAGEKQTKRTTIYDLAELARTSPSAVSAVLNGTWKKRRISAALAERITLIANEQGYAVNLQASALRRDRSRIIGMIVPKYDNRYFGAIVERFEDMARARGLFPIVTCTRRDPELEEQAARTMISHQVDCLIATGATNPDRIADICAPAGVNIVNLDLPGTKAPSVISDNFGGARDLTRLILKHCETEFGKRDPLLFVGGRSGDHNTSERIRGFRAAHTEMGIELEAQHVRACGYAAEKAEQSLTDLAIHQGPLPHGMFVNSTITLEGVVRWLRQNGHSAKAVVRLGCFDWDPFAAFLDETVEMVRQDAPRMLDAVFDIIDREDFAPKHIEVPPIPVPGAACH